MFRVFLAEVSNVLQMWNIRRIYTWFLLCIQNGFNFCFGSEVDFLINRCTALLSEQNKLLAKVSIFILFAIALGFNIFARVIYTGVTGLCEVNSDLGMDVVSKIAFIFMYLLLLFSILVPIVQTINGSGVSNDTAAIIRNVSQRLITAIGVTLIMIVLLLIFPDHYVRIMHVIQNYTIIRASSHPNASNSNSWSNAARSSRSNRQDI
jgi:hypothetical protein